MDRRLQRFARPLGQERDAPGGASFSQRLHRFRRLGKRKPLLREVELVGVEEREEVERELAAARLAAQHVDGQHADVRREQLRQIEVARWPAV